MLDRRTFAGLLGAAALPGTAQAKTTLPFYAATGPNLAIYDRAIPKLRVAQTMPLLAAPDLPAVLEDFRVALVP